MPPTEIATLAIAHREGSSPSVFTLNRLRDGESIPPVTIPSPYAFPVHGRPNSKLMQELRWYLEDFLRFPFPPEIANQAEV
jgi:hypothetical protein